MGSHKELGAVRQARRHGPALLRARSGRCRRPAFFCVHLPIHIQHGASRHGSVRCFREQPRGPGGHLLQERGAHPLHRRPQRRPCHYLRLCGRLGFGREGAVVRRAVSDEQFRRESPRVLPEERSAVRLCARASRRSTCAAHSQGNVYLIEFYVILRNVM